MDVKIPQISRTDCLAEEKKNGANYEEAMNEAFKEIFTNLKEIEKDTGRMRRLRADLERRRSSAPATVLRDQLKAFRKPKQTERRLSTPPLTTWSEEVNELSTQLPHKPSSGKRNKSSELPTAPHPRRSRLSPTTRWVLACSEEDGV